MEFTFYKICSEKKPEFEYLDFTTSFKHIKSMHKRKTLANLQREPYTTINSLGGWDCINIIVQKKMTLESKRNAKYELENMKRCSQPLHRSCTELHNFGAGVHNLHNFGATQPTRENLPIKKQNQLLIWSAHYAINNSLENRQSQDILRRIHVKLT